MVASSATSAGCQHDPNTSAMVMTTTVAANAADMTQLQLHSGCWLRCKRSPEETSFMQATPGWHCCMRLTPANLPPRHDLVSPGPSPSCVTAVHESWSPNHAGCQGTWKAPLQHGLPVSSMLLPTQTACFLYFLSNVGSRSSSGGRNGGSSISDLNKGPEPAGSSRISQVCRQAALPEAGVAARRATLYPTGQKFLTSWKPGWTYSMRPNDSTACRRLPNIKRKHRRA